MAGFLIEWSQKFDEARAKSVFPIILETLHQFEMKEVFWDHGAGGVKRIGADDLERNYIGTGRFRLDSVQIPLTHQDPPPEQGEIRERRAKRPQLRSAELWAPCPATMTDVGIQRALERLIHQTAPRRITLGPWEYYVGHSQDERRARGALVYLGANESAIAKRLDLGLRLVAGAAGGGWVRAHARALDAQDDESFQARRVLYRALTLIEVELWQELRREHDSRRSSAVISNSSSIVVKAEEPAEAPEDRAPTMLPVAPMIAVLPFSGQTDIKTVSTELQASPDAGFAEELPSPERLAEMRLRALGPLAYQEAGTMSLSRYAALRAQLTLSGEDNLETLREFGIASLEQKASLQQGFFQLFQRHPAQRDEFQRMLAAALSRTGRPT